MDEEQPGRSKGLVKDSSQAYFWEWTWNINIPEPDYSVT